MSALTDLSLVCPQCKCEIRHLPAAFHCPACLLDFPIVCGIPDFRLQPDPYIALKADRAKGLHLWEAGQSRTFKQMLDYYYSITPEDPADLAVHWTAHALAEVAIAQDYLAESKLKGYSLLDIGCSTGGMVAAARDRFKLTVGVDCAFRWLVIGQLRLRELGVSAQLICANAEALPFANNQFDAVTAVDVIEHVRDAEAMLRECRRILRPQGELIGYTNNRYAPLPDPQVGLWCVGWLPRLQQASYVAWRRNDLHRYQVNMFGWGQLKNYLRAAGYKNISVGPALLSAPHKPKLAKLLSTINVIQKWPLIRQLLTALGPRLSWRAGIVE